VDAITSATYSSEVIKDAIRNALRNGIEYVESENEFAEIIKIEDKTGDDK
jgi:FMN-binding domain.